MRVEASPRCRRPRTSSLSTFSSSACRVLRGSPKRQPGEKGHTDAELPGVRVAPAHPLAVGPGTHVTLPVLRPLGSEVGW